jgi:fumarate reductase subunit D
VLAVCVLVHLATIIYAVQGGLTAAEILGRTRGNHAWLAFYTVFVLAVSVHSADRAASRIPGVAAMARRVARYRLGAFRWSSRVDGNASGARGVRVKKGSSYWVAIVHRVSGIALAIFLPLHFWALSTALQLDAFLAWTRQPAVLVAEWAIVVALAAHFAGGLRVLALGVSALARAAEDARRARRRRHGAGGARSRVGAVE